MNQRHNFLVLLGCFMPSVHLNYSLSKETIKAFDDCENMEELIEEVSLRISDTQGNTERAKAFIFDNILEWIRFADRKLDVSDC